MFLDHDLYDEFLVSVENLSDFALLFRSLLNYSGSFSDDDFSVFLRSLNFLSDQISQISDTLSVVDSRFTSVSS